MIPYLRKTERVKILYYAFFVFFCILIFESIIVFIDKIINEEGNAYLKYLTHPYWFFNDAWVLSSSKRERVVFKDSNVPLLYTCIRQLWKENVIDHSLIYEYIILDTLHNPAYVFYRLTSPDNDVNIFYIATEYLGYGDRAFSTCLKYIELLDDVNSKPIIIKVDHYPQLIRYPFS